jgi:CRP-like cAMP-binding protein
MFKSLAKLWQNLSAVHMIAIMSSAIMDLFAKTPLRRLPQGEHLFLTGDPVTHLALVTSGRINLVRRTGAGAEMVLQRAGEGQILAEASVYSPSYHCDAKAMQMSCVALIPVGIFRARLKDDAALGEAWAEHLAHAVQKARTVAEIRTLRTVGERLDAWLGESRSLPAKGLWYELAMELGVSPEALYRELGKRRRTVSGRPPGNG